MRSLIVSLLIIPVILSGGTTVAAEDIRFTIEPEPVMEHQMAKLTCQITQKIRSFHYMQLKYGSKRVLVYLFLEHKFNLMGQWKGRNIETKFDKSTNTMTVEFAVREEDNGALTCEMARIQYPSENDRLANINIRVLKAPRIKKFFVRPFSISEPFHPKSTSYSEGDKVSVVCQGALGLPEATTRLTMNDEKLDVQRGKKEKTVFPNKYNQVDQQAYVTLSDKDHGAQFKCLLKNRIGMDVKDYTITVRYKVRDLKFRYNTNTKLQVGKGIKCSARGNPAPRVNVTILPVDNSTHNSDGSLPAWTLNSTLGYGKAEKKIPLEARPGIYSIRCVAYNNFRGQRHYERSEVVQVQVIALQKANMGLILGISIPAGIIFLLIVFCCCKSHRRKKRDKEAEGRHLDSYVPKRNPVGQHGRRPNSSHARDKKEDRMNNSPPRGGPSSSGLSSSYQREEDPAYPTTPLTNYNSPRKPPRSITSSSSGRHWSAANLDSRDAYSPADGASVPFGEDAVIHDPQNKSLEAEEEFV